MGYVLMWELFMAVNAGIAWCLWTLAREAHRHVRWHIDARRQRREDAGQLILAPAPVPAPDFRVIPVPRLPGQPEPVAPRLRRVV